jgi:hypothetical protein
MKQRNFYFIFLSLAFSLLSCKGNSQGNKKNENTSTGNASFSCKVHGKDFSGKGTDQITNAAFVHAPGIIYFTLSPILAGRSGPPYGFGFEGTFSDTLIEPKTGRNVPVTDGKFDIPYSTYSKK